MSAPNRSARFASSFMKLILVASMAFAAYLVSSAELHVHDDEFFAAARERLVERAQQFGDARIVGAHHHAIRTHEVFDGRAFLEEFRVGNHVEFDIGTALRRATRRPRRRTLSAVPTGTVDLVMTTLYSVMCSPMERATASTYLRSAEPSSSGGVPTAMSWNRPCSTPSFAEVVNFRRSASMLRLDQGVEARLVDGNDRPA